MVVPDTCIYYQNTDETGEGGNMTPCVQGERLAKMETVLEYAVDILREQKEIGAKTLDRLDTLSIQGEQLKVLITDVAKLKVDMERAFEYIRKINKRHDIETGEEIIQSIWRKRIDFFLEKLSVPFLMGFCFMIWLIDKFNIFGQLVKAWKEFKG